MVSIPKFSIITICLNEKEMVRGTIDSVINQTFRDFEWIIIDGGSTDGTLEILKKYKKYYSYFISEPDKGIYHAMNKGLRYASGEYIQFLNAGDYYHDNSVLQKVSYFFGKAEILHGSLLTIDNGERVVLRDPNPITKKHMLSKTIKHPASFVKRELTQKVGGFDESFKIAGDYDFFLKAVIKHHASTLYMDVLVVVFDLNGIARNNPEIRKLEQDKARKQNLGLFGVELIRLNENVKLKANKLKNVFK